MCYLMNLSFDKEHLEEEEDFNSNLVNYFRTALVEGEIKKFARKIVENFNPKTVLDCGCVGGFLVLELKKLGVKAFGVSSSKKIIETVDEEAKQFCWFSSIANMQVNENDVKKYDLIIPKKTLF